MEAKMAESARQKRITGRVMHGFKHGELKSGPGGKGGPVKSRRQAIAIALEEAGDSKNESDTRNERNLHRIKTKEAEGKEREGKSHVGASGKRESSRALWVARMPGSQRRAARRPRMLARTPLTVTPVTNSMPKRNGGILRDDRR
ncbi:MAG TPA: DUF6496 domain-containing protein [Roseiarcus sp.]|jgi:hypothetical protein